MQELVDLDATAQAELVRKKELKPIELVEAAIRRIEAVNPKLNAVIHPLFDFARKTASGPLPDGPFTGVPYLLKDLLASLGGAPIRMGSRSMKDYVATYDSELVARSKKAGLVIVGKTNTPELGILPTTEPLSFGPSRNPWNLAHTTGGSSGGSAAAVAAGMVPMAHANDGGGSIRIPASCCGLFGLKPTRARNPLGPDFGDIMHGFVCEHAVTRSVRDSARLLDATSGPDAGDPYAAPPPARPYADEVKRDPGRLRIAFSTQAPTGVEIHPDCIAAVAETAKLLRELGHEVVEATPALEGPGIAQSFLAVYSAQVAIDMANLSRALGRTLGPDDVEPLTFTLGELGRQVTATDYALAIQWLHGASRILGRFLIEYHAWLTPTLAGPPLPLGSFDPTPDNPIAPMMRAAEWVPFTPIANFSGLPAMSVPLYWNAAGLPIGSHFFGRFGDEGTLFSLAAQLERARPWAKRRPPVFAAG